MNATKIWRSLGALIPAAFLLSTATVSAQAPGTAYEVAQPAAITATSVWGGGPWNNGPVPNAIDGDHSTSWNSGGNGPTTGPASVTVTFDSPRVFSGLYVTAHAFPAETMHYTITATRPDNSTVVVAANFYIKSYLDGLTSQVFDLGQGFVEYTSVQIDIGGITGWKAINEIELIVPVAPVNVAPDASGAAASIGSLWPPNNKMVDISIEGVTDADGDEVTITIDSISDDEGSDSDDAVANGDTASLRAQRDGKGDGRTYTIEFTADDGNGGVSTGSVTVEVAHDQGKKKEKMKGGKLATGAEATSWGAIKKSMD
jgi:hypothetical protein